jgi:hypothetical protein
VVVDQALPDVPGPDVGLVVEHGVDEPIDPDQGVGLAVDLLRGGGMGEASA